MRTRHGVLAIDVRTTPSWLGPEWSPAYVVPVTFTSVDFVAAMDNIVRNPHINSSTLLRADILFEHHNTTGTSYHAAASSIALDDSWLRHNIQDTTPRIAEFPSSTGLELESYQVRRNIPRNPLRDAIVNQTCAFYTSAIGDKAVVYVPHLLSVEDTPFYLPQALAVALVFEAARSSVSVHFKMYPETVPLAMREPSDRLVRIGWHLVNASTKHAGGEAAGYRQRVKHDRVVDRIRSQNRYLLLKQRYAQHLINNWVEKTDPGKHVFEELGIAAFLIELWEQMYPNKDSFKFLDLGCGNGLLVYVLTMEGYTGEGFDARTRKSWVTYPENVQERLHEKFVVPKYLHDLVAETDDPNRFAVIDGSPDVFLIGNHSDELTLWMPLFGSPFLVIPCCSHNLSGKRTRFYAKKGEDKSAYAGLVAKTVDLATRAGWHVETEMLRIPSTRNAAVIGRRLVHDADVNIDQIIQDEGGADDWITTIKALAKKPPAVAVV